MKRLKIKVCGLREPGNVQEVAAVKPDYAGFIYFKDSKRWVGKNFDPAVLNLLQPETKTCGVFVGEFIPALMDKVDYYFLDAVQLHGDEPLEYCKKLRARLPEIEIIKAVNVDENFDFTSLAPFEGLVNYFLFDTKGKERGGNGTPFDWTVLNKYTLKTPYFLSGGIGRQSISAIKQIAEHSDALVGIDLNSCFETAPAVKSMQELTEFLRELQ